MKKIENEKYNVKKLKNEIKLNYKYANDLDKKVLYIISFSLFLLLIGLSKNVSSIPIISNILNITGASFIGVSAALSCVAFSKRMKNVKLKEKLEQAENLLKNVETVKSDIEKSLINNKNYSYQGKEIEPIIDELLNPINKNSKNKVKKIGTK